MFSGGIERGWSNYDLTDLYYILLLFYKTVFLFLCVPKINEYHSLLIYLDDFYKGLELPFLRFKCALCLIRDIFIGWWHEDGSSLKSVIMEFHTGSDVEIPVLSYYNKTMNRLIPKNCFWHYCHRFVSIPVIDMKLEWRNSKLLAMATSGNFRFDR